MTSDDAAALGGGVTAGTTGPLPFETSAAHEARIYNYVLGGKDNYAADRAAAEAALKAWPDMAFAARETGASQPPGPRWVALKHHRGMQARPTVSGKGHGGLAVFSV